MSNDAPDMPWWAQKAMNQLDEDQFRGIAVKLIEEEIQPHLKDIRERARETEDPEEVRDVFENQRGDEKRDEVFHSTWASLIGTAVQLRTDPLAGFKNLKPLLRDPYTLEAVLMMMEDDEIPSEISEANKDMIATYVHWMGIAIAPEMYDRSEVEEMVEQFGADPALLDKYDNAVADEGE